MIFGSVCSGIEAASCAWHPLGWRAAFVSEIEAFPRAVLQHRWPEAPLHGDFTTIEAGQYDPIDLLVGGTPCQSFSVAGLRGGLADDRGNLALEYLRLADRLRPRWLVWENVPGVLSSAGGRDFGSILGGLVELGYGFAYRVLDAQFFGVAQRRRRVFVVGHLGDWRRAAAVLFERHSLQGHPAPSREAGQRAAGTIAGGARQRGGYSADDIPAVAHCLNAHGGAGRMDGESETFAAEFAPALSRSNPYGDHESREGLLVAHSLRGEGFDASEDGTGHGTPIVPVAYQTSGNCGAWETGDITGALDTNTDPNSHVLCFSSKDHGADVQRNLAPTLRAGAHDGSHANAGVPPAIAYGITRDALDRSGEGAAGNAAERSGLGILENVAQTIKARGPGAVAFALRGREGGAMPEVGGSISNALRTPGGGASVPMVATSAVRRLTPRECERLQGFADDYTAIPYRGKLAADGPRYKALGNSMAVPVMRWIGERIAAVDALSTERAAA
jgi:DNA (cytosine-5)-methyltransferase 1